MVFFNLLWYKAEIAVYQTMLNGGEQPFSYDDLISSVFVIDAIMRAMESGKGEEVRYVKV